MLLKDISKLEDSLLYIYLYFRFSVSFFMCSDTRERAGDLPLIYYVHQGLNNTPFYTHVNLYKVWRMEPPCWNQTHTDTSIKIHAREYCAIMCKSLLFVFCFLL